jgi:hypothetical protein
MRTSLLVAALLASVASCGVETDDRVPTAEYLVPAIFRPSCGTAACHSSATGRENLVLDTIEGVCAASRLSERGPLTTWMRDGAPGGNRMPLDSPLPEADIDLIDLWYYEGDTPREPLPGCP